MELFKDLKKRLMPVAKPGTTEEDNRQQYVEYHQDAIAIGEQPMTYKQWADKVEREMMGGKSV